VQSVILDKTIESQRDCGSVEFARRTLASAIGFSVFVLVNILLFTRPAEFFPTLSVLHLYYVSMLLSLLLFAPQMVGQLRGDLARERPITPMVILLLPMIFLTSLGHGYVGLCAEYTLAFFKVALYFLLVMCAVRTPQQLRRFVLWIALCSVIITLVPLLDHHGYISSKALHTLKDTRVDPDTGKIIRVQRLQSVGIFADPNDLAQMAGTGVLLCVYAVVSTRRWELKTLWAAPIPFMFYSIHLTKSRGGLLAIGAGLAMLFLAHFGIRKSLLLAAVCLPLMAVALGVRSESFSTEEGSAQSRVRLWSDSLEGLKSNPVIGVGAGAMGEFYMDQVAHNTFLHMFGELGLVGGYAFFGAFYVAVWGLLRAWPPGHQVTDPTLRTLRPFIVAAIATYGMGMMSLSRGYEVPTYTLLGIAAVWLMLAHTRPHLPPLRLDRPLMKQILIAGAAYLVAMHIFVRLSVRWSG
jgi:O-antigen ligase